MKMKPWAIDARESIPDVESVEEIDVDSIEQTEDIKDFLSGDRTFYLVVATKGVGKSLLLLSKRKVLGNMVFVPEHTPLDVPNLTFAGLDRSARALLYQENMLKDLWSMSIIIAVIKRLNIANDLIEKEVSSSLKKILKEDTLSTVSSIFTWIISEVGKSSFYELAHDYNQILMPIVNAVKKPVAVFIDNVDECFEGEGDRNIWYDAQNTLIKAIYNLVRVNKNLKIFASIRKEAFLKLSSEMKRQYDSVCLKVIYEKKDLKDIFIKNIQKENEAKLQNKALRITDTIRAFIGIDKITHGYFQEEEKIFDYIFRHTLQRPRDLMEIGGKISRCKKEDRDPAKEGGKEKIKSLVNQAAADIGKDYIAEALRHLTITESNLKRVYGLIKDNIITRKKLETICGKFNKRDCTPTHNSCKACQKIHIFCELYKIGLLGYVTNDPRVKDRKIQTFVLVGEKTFDDVGLLPRSTHYLMHPILEELIRQENGNIKIKNIVGYDMPWEIRSKKVLKKHNDLSHSQPTQKSLRTIKDIAKEKLKIIYAANFDKFVNQTVAFEMFDIVAKIQETSPNVIIATTVKIGHKTLTEIKNKVCTFENTISTNPEKGKIFKAHIFFEKNNNEGFKSFLESYKNNLITWEELDATSY